MFRAIFLIAVFIVAAGIGDPAHAERRVALVIGNSNYQHSTVLPNPKNDATAIADSLKSLGFEVISGMDLDKAGMDRTIREFATTLGDAPVAVFFYAGHGLQVNGKNYLVPIDAEAKSTAALDFEMVQLDVVQRTMESLPGRASILFFDACRNNPLSRNLAAGLGTRSLNIGRGLAIQESGTGTLISYSTQPGNEALDGTGTHSPYAASLLKQMSTSTEHISDMLMAVRNDVLKETSGKQCPWTTEALTQKFYLREPAPAQSTPPPVAALPPALAPPATAAVPPATQPDGRAAPLSVPPPSVANPATGAPAALPPVIDDQGPAIAPGDMAMSGFSGTRLGVDSLKPGIHPIEKTVIDSDRAAIRVFRMGKIGPLNARVLTPSVKMEVKAKDIGQVFGLTFDDGNRDASGRRVPNLFAVATSSFGLNIVGADGDSDGKPDRTKAGSPTAAFMDGQFGTKLGGGPGSIWKIDGNTGQPSLFANVALDGRENSGPGLGDIAFDDISGNFYVSDLDTGMIHRFDPTGTDLGHFDHGVDGRKAASLEPVADDGKRADISSADFKADDPGTWGFTQKERRVHAVAVRESRLYYSIARGPEIWSVALKPDGAFDSDARLELRIGGDADSTFATASNATSTPPPATNVIVTDIAFDSSGHLVVAERSSLLSPYDFSAFAAAGEARVVRFARAKSDDESKPVIWGPAGDEYPVGYAPGFRQASGGVSFGYGRRDGDAVDFSKCDAQVLATGDALRDNPAFAAQLRQGGPLSVHGAQVSSVELFGQTETPPAASVFVDFDASYDDASLRGQIGDVEVFRRCGEEDFPAIAAAQGGGFPPVAGSGANSGGFPPVAGQPGGVAGGAGGGGGDVSPITGGGEGPQTMFSNLRIEKTATGGECNERGDCTFEIAVTNTSAAPIDGPFLIDEALTSGSVPISNAKITAGNAPQWTCSKAAPFACMRNEAIAPGDRILLPVTVTPAPGGTETSLTNCATLLAPAALVSSPPNSTVGGLKISPRATTPTCAPSGGCEIEVSITNTGGQVFKGPVSVIELFASHGGKLNEGLGNDASLEANPDAPWTCSKQGLPWRCTHPSLTLSAGASTTFKLKMKPGAVKADDRFFAASTALEVATPDGTKTSDFTAANIVLDRTAPAAGSTAPGGAEPAGARDTKSARPTGTVPPRACATVKLKPPAEPPPNPEVATERPKLKVAKKALASFCPLTGPCPFEITVTNVGPEPFNGPLVLNESVNGGDPGKLSAAGGARGDVSITTLSSEWSCANGSKGSECSPRQAVKLDAGQSTTLKVDVLPQGWTKGNVLENCVSLKSGSGDASGDRACATIELDPFNVSIIKSGDQSCRPGGACTFRLTLFNDGPIVHNAPVTITDSMGPGAPAMTIASISPPLPCAAQPTQIPFSCTSPGRHPLAIGQREEFTITTNMPGEPPASKTLRNCASVERPWAAAAGREGAGPVVDGANQECHEFSVTPPDPSCYGGMILTADKQCACPGAMKWNGKSCAAAPVAQCPVGWTGAYPYCCQPGFIHVNGACKPLTCPAGWTGTYPYCCQSGYQYVNGACKQLVAETERERSCPESRPVGAYPNCCPEGTRYRRGACRATVSDPPETRSCPRDRPVGEYPNCCPRGSYYRRGKCRYRNDDAGPSTYQQGSDKTVVKVCPNGKVRFIWQKCPSYGGNYGNYGSYGNGGGNYGGHTRWRDRFPNYGNKTPPGWYKPGCPVETSSGRCD